MPTSERGVAIFLNGPVDGRPDPHSNSYVVDYQPEFWAVIGQPWLITSPAIIDARVFPSIVEARDYWMQPVPGEFRHDGKPQRPLTGYTVTMMPVILEEE